MSRFRVGSVPYANALPLVDAFEEPDSDVEVLYRIPSLLPELLATGEAQAILVSSVDALRTPGRRMAHGVCIGSEGPVKSVRLFSKVEPAAIRSLALDESSMTSNRLAQIVLAEMYGATPVTRSMPPNQDEMLAQSDACVLIGDIGMRASSDGLFVVDLGEAWTSLTGEPFVWAAWIGADGLTDELARLLRAASDSSGLGRGAPRTPGTDAFVQEASERTGWPVDVLDDYYRQVMVYDMDERMLDGLREFQRRLLEHGFEDCRHFPGLV